MKTGSHMTQLMQLKESADLLYYRYEYHDLADPTEIRDTILDLINIVKCLTTTLLVEAYKNEPVSD